MDYTFLANLQNELAPPEEGILSRILRKDEKVNITLFGFSSGQELSRAFSSDACNSLFSGRRS